ncbi:DUF1702 family protein [Nocardiopsis sp. NRRL B-16309]|uniref:DUF1702 family protein n=1 Tax=Nocardiopsis sp. NRRL B-16309 TaxID=1519494 RepID=UPI0006ADAED5|nr:DUF1702 family protein [Nocardiopsis sp. NRRL B-16309]KOX24120.1 enediyne biosynthesis protein [Nocardiopsis sp. NRRL B-16309]
MASLTGALRRRVLTPDPSETTLETRGFHDKGPAGRSVLETVGASFLAGLGDAVETASPERTDARLTALGTRYRGFAYEGAAMGFALLDALSFRGGRTRRFLDGPGASHVYMAYVGIGWAMARLPGPLWPGTGDLDPVLRWLVHDGYGFHQAYFHTEAHVHRRERDERAARRTGDGPYALRAADQGIGRALWFVAGTDAERAAELVEGFPAERRQDLFAGLGLAATYAGGADEEELTALRERAGEHRWFLAQGSAFAAEARVRAGLVVPHTETATRVLCSLGAEEAARLSRDHRPDASGPDPAPDRPWYEVWRVALAEEFAHTAGAGDLS